MVGAPMPTPARLRLASNRLNRRQRGNWGTPQMAGSSPRWQWIAIALLVLCIIGYIWTLK